MITNGQVYKYVGDKAPNISTYDKVIAIREIRGIEYNAPTMVLVEHVHGGHYMTVNKLDIAELPNHCPAHDNNG